MLGWNQIGDRGLAALVPVLEQCAGSLKCLDLLAGQIGSAEWAAAGLAEAVALCAPGLRDLRLGDNDIGIEGLTTLLPALAQLTELTRLHLGGIGMDFEVRERERFSSRWGSHD